MAADTWYDYDLSGVLVATDVVRPAANVAAQVLNLDGSPVSVRQNDVAVTTIQLDATGSARFQVLGALAVLVDAGSGRFARMAQQAYTAAADAVDTAQGAADTADSALSVASGVEALAQQALELAQQAMDHSAAAEAPTLADLELPCVIAHRGGALVSPETSMTAWHRAVAYGTKWIDLDAQQLGDGTWACMHNTTVDATTTTTGAVADHTAGSWRKLRLNPLVPGPTTFGADYDEAPPLLTDVLREFGNRYLLSIECKTYGQMGSLIALLESWNISRDSVLLSSFNRDTAKAAATAGWHAMLNVGSAIPDLAGVAADGFEWLCTTMTGASAATCTAAHALGLKVTAYTINRRCDYQTLVNRGCDAVYSDDPEHVGGVVAAKRDLFASLWYPPGMQLNTVANTHPVLASAGGLTLPKLAADDGSREYLTLGYLGPTDPTNFTITYEINIGVDVAGRFGSIGLMRDDAPYNDDGTTTGNGYVILLSTTGVVTVYKVVNGAATSLGGTGSDTAVTASTWVPITVQVTPTTIRATRTDTGKATAALADTTFRPCGVVMFGHRYVQARLRNVTLT